MSVLSDTESLRLLPKSPISKARFTTFDQAKVRKQLCDLCGLCEAAVWENRVVAREGPGLSGVLVAGYAKIRYHSGSHSSTHIGIC